MFKTSNVLSSKKAIYITMFIPGKSTFRSINIKYNINIKRTIYSK